MKIKGTKRWVKPIVKLGTAKTTVTKSKGCSSCAKRRNSK